MRFRAEVYHTDTRDLALDLGEWETQQQAQAACFSHVNQPLVWEERSFRFWQARTKRYWYQIAAVLE